MGVELTIESKGGRYIGIHGEKDGPLYFVLTEGPYHMRVETTQAELVELMATVARWLGFPLGGCPSCAREARSLDRAFCFKCRETYHMSQTGQGKGPEGGGQ